MLKQYRYFLLIILVIGLLGCVYYFFIDDHEYYDAYHQQAVASNNALDLSMQIIAPSMSSMISSTYKSSLMNSMLNQAKANDTVFDEAQNNATLALKYQKKMQKTAHSDSQKKYAELLINQTTELIQYLNTAKTLNQQGKEKELMNLFQEFNMKTQYYQKEIETLKKENKSLRKRLHQEDKKISEDNPD